MNLIIKQTLKRVSGYSSYGPNTFQFLSRFSFSDGHQKQDSAQENQSQNADVSKMTIDHRKIKEKLKTRDTSLNIKTYKIHSPKEYYKDKPHPSKDIFLFNEPQLNQKSYELQIFGIGNGYFSVNDVWYPGSILAFPYQIFLWDVNRASDIRAHSFDILEVIKPIPRYVIVGTGKEKYDLDESYYSRFTEKGIKIDVLPTFEACSTYNVCNEDRMNIAAFLIPANL